MLSPSNKRSPEKGLSKLDAVFNRVVFPQPFFPIMLVMLPFSKYIFIF